MLSKTAKETISVLPGILDSLPNIDASKCSIYSQANLAPLDPSKCPHFTIEGEHNGTRGTGIRVIGQDTLDAAIGLMKEPSQLTFRETVTSGLQRDRVAVLNLASDRNPGGGWLGGALAQEESLCYRTSLHLSLDKSLYPIPAASVLYSPDVVIIREEFKRGHKLLIPSVNPAELPVVSVISVAAIRRPKIQRLRQEINGVLIERDVFASEADRELAKTKMRISLRIAGTHGHHKLVLGALGCGAFCNPSQEVAHCWLEVLKEPEFAGGWWREVVFAVLDKGTDGDNAARDQSGNFTVFAETLDGQIV
jgi:uncharacterized protein (TIGR02452 family)